MIFNLHIYIEIERLKLHVQIENHVPLILHLIRVILIHSLFVF